MRTRPLSLVHDNLAFNGVCSYFQPILSGRQKCVIGFEAADRSLPSRATIRGFAGLQSRSNGLVLFTKVDPSTTPRNLADELYDTCHAEGISPRNVAVEFLESRIDDFERMCSLSERLRELGFVFTLSDSGFVSSNLNRIPIIKPDLLKIGRDLVENIDADYFKQETFKSLVGLGRRTNALVVADGIETEMEGIVSLELGADMLQGGFLSRPLQLDESMDNEVADAIQRTEALAANFKSYVVGKINERKLQHRRLNVILNQALCELTSLEESEFARLLARTISQQPAVECMYVLSQDGVQVTDTICNPLIVRRNYGILFHPAQKGSDHCLKEYFYILMDLELPKYTTDPYVSLASGNLCRTISTVFRDAANNKLYVLCIDVVADDLIDLP